MDEKKTDIQVERERFEQEKMTRRAALRKFGITTGMSVFGLFAVDDLARVVIGKMQEHEATKKIADGLAREFKNAGAVFADAACQQCCTDLNTCDEYCINQYSSCKPAHPDDGYCEYLYHLCVDSSSNYDSCENIYLRCSRANCPTGSCR